jgi:8-oxo-dGTP pyrophosphatase MutT (NUDIX family)
MPFTIVASVGQPGVYAAVDETDTTAVINLCRYHDGQTFTREPGGWASDDITLPWLVASGVPLALIPDTELRGLLRAYDDHLAVFPVMAAATSDPQVAGLGVRALDTGRVLMLQRALAPNGDDPAAGTWEMPGGHLDPGEDPLSGAIREWQEETGCQLPDGSLWGVWHSPDGVYQGHIYNVNSEADVPIHDGRDQVINPDDPDGDLTEALAWWDPRDLSNPLVRPELANQTPAVHDALSATPSRQMTATVASLDAGGGGGGGGAAQQQQKPGQRNPRWDPRKHPRQPDGEFAPAGTGSSSSEGGGSPSGGGSSKVGGPVPKTHAVAYHPPKSGGGSGKTAGKKTATAQKTAIRRQTSRREQGLRDAEARRHEQARNAYEEQGIAEQQRQADAADRIAALPAAERKSATAAEHARHQAWLRQRQHEAVAERERHHDAEIRIRAEVTALNTQRDKRLAAMVADAVAHTRTPRALENYWVRGEGAAKIRWGTGNDWYRCVAQLSKYVHNPYVVKGQCNSLHKIATGLWPATHDKILHGGKGK